MPLDRRRSQVSAVFVHRRLPSLPPEQAPGVVPLVECDSATALCRNALCGLLLSVAGMKSTSLSAVLSEASSRPIAKRTQNGEHS